MVAALARVRAINRAGPRSSERGYTGLLNSPKFTLPHYGFTATVGEAPVDVGVMGSNRFDSCSKKSTSLNG